MLMKELLTVLDNNEEPFGKRLKIADNAFKSSELPLPHKEAILLKWIIKQYDCNNKEAWDMLTNWMNSDQFKYLNRNDIDTEEINSIVRMVKETVVLMETSEYFTMQKIFDSLLLLIENGLFQQYFRSNIAIYCELISHILVKIQCPIYFEEFLKKLFYNKNIITEDKFHKYFLDFIVPTLANCLIRFNDNNIFQQVSKVVQKSIFYRNHKNFTVYVNQFFEDNKVEKQTVPKTLIKNLLDFYKLDKQSAAITYKLILHAFCNAYDADFELVYKFFILLVHIIGFNLKDKFIFHKVSKLEISESELSLNKSQEIILELLDILSENKNNLDYKVKETTLTDFIRNIMRQILYFNTPSAVCYKIFIKAISIDPLVIQPITDYIIMYTMMADNCEKMEEYENLIISIFEVYSKMHRIESLVSKIVSTLNDGFNSTPVLFKEIYEFKGERDVNILMEKGGFRVDNIFTEKILEYFSKCICNLASWQVINVFKTLLHYLQKVLSYIHKVGNDNVMYFTYMEILSTLIGTLLCSIRIAEHTVAINVVEKSVRELEELRDLLKQFGLALLNKEHIHMLMHSFLSIAYNWAEIYIMLEFYSIDNAVQLKKSLDNDFTSCNITYLHSYLNIQQWCLISERITNFGELPCKELLQRLYLQKLRAMLLFEKKVNSDIVSNILRSITANLESNWRDILQDKYVVNNLLQRMNSTSITFLAESVVNNISSFGNFHRQPHILNSSLLITAINYITIKKINKLLIKRKRRISENMLSNALSTNIYSLFKEDKFLNDETLKEMVEKAKEIYHLGNGNNRKNFEWRINEEKMIDLFEILRKFPVIYSSETVQKMYLLYFSSLHKDLSSEFKNGNNKKLQASCEMLIIGILQQCKFKLVDVFDLNIFCKEIVRNYDEWEQIFSLVTENVFKCENSIKEFEILVHDFTKKLLNPIYMRCCIIIINAVNKLKKNKMKKDVKNMAEKYKTHMCDTVVELVSKTQPDACLINGYTYALRTFLSQNDDEKVSKLLSSLNCYVDFALKNAASSECGNLMLIITVLQNKSKLKLVDDDLPKRVWDAYKVNGAVCSRFEEYFQLIVLIFGSIPNEEFATVTTDLLNITEKSIDEGDLVLFNMHLKSWESVLSCSLNPIKIKMLSEVVEMLLHKLVSMLQHSTYSKELYESIFKFEKTLIQTVHLLLTPPMIDILILSVKLFMNTVEQDFENIFNLSVSSLECLLRYRRPLIMDRLPPYLQQYRLLLSSLCKRSNSDLNLGDLEIALLSDCAHQLEKLTKNLVSCQRDMGRIAMYLVADILEQYEQTTIYPNIKIHLNNCIYSLISICDQHAVAYLMRVLSSASTEIFKIMYENYKKYYRFTGKV